MLAGLGACMRLDAFLFAPTPAGDGVDLLAPASGVPADLRQELTGVVAQDGTVVSSWLLAHRPDDGTPVTHHGSAVLYCHGNVQNVATFALRGQALWSLGYTVLLFDYRGYGKTRGVPSEAGIYADATAARAWLTEHGGFAEPQVALYGYSLGSAVAAQLAVDAATPALLLESPFASVGELLDDSATLSLPLPWFADASMDTRGKIGAHQGALLVMHGVEDHYIQVRYGQEVYDAATAAQPKALWEVPGASHDTVPCAVVDPPGEPRADCRGAFSAAYLERVGATLGQALGAPGG